MLFKQCKQLVVLSGKGGTGKTTVALALSKLIDNKIIVDADVDAANMHLILKHKIKSELYFYGEKKAGINLDNCSQCSICESVCRFEAIKNFKINKASCEGCGFCYHVCPENAISFEISRSGTYYECELEDNSIFYYAKLFAGEGNSGKLVSELKKKALEKAGGSSTCIIIDGPPGIGCPVNASLSGADFIIIVSEPTQSGLHDLKRLVKLLKIFVLKSGIIINKYNINPQISEIIEKYCISEQISILAKIPFDHIFIQAVQNYKNIIDYNEHYKNLFLNILENINKNINTKMEEK